MQFGEDWPGLFIRGDNALHYAVHLAMLVKNLPDEVYVELTKKHGFFISKGVLMGLVDDLLSVDVKTLDLTRVQHAQLERKIIHIDTNLKR